MKGTKKNASSYEPTKERACLLGQVTGTTKTEEVPVYEGMGRIAAQDYVARFPYPPFDRSPLDGYTQSPHCIPSGISKEQPLQRTTILQKGDRLVTQGDQLTPASLALLSLQGYGMVRVYQRRNIGVVSTGNEQDDLDSAPTQEKHVPVFAVSGYHKTGKTTVLEAAIAALVQQNCIVGVIKHDGHGFVPDVPGTDSDRLKKAGAKGVMVCSDILQEFVQDIDALDASTAVRWMKEQMHYTPDVILLEGFKSCNYPKLMLTEAMERAQLQEQGRQLAQYLLEQVVKNEPRKHQSKKEGLPL